MARLEPELAARVSSLGRVRLVAAAMAAHPREEPVQLAALELLEALAAQPDVQVG